MITTLVVREQRLVNRHGVAAKGDGPHGGHRRDYAWAGAGIVAVAIFGLGLGAVHNASTRSAATPTGTTTTSNTGRAAVHPTTALGDVSSFTVIVKDVQGKVGQNDLTGATTKVKDLEVAWDSAEAGLKPRDPADWKTIDSQIEHLRRQLATRGRRPSARSRARIRSSERLVPASSGSAASI